MIGRGANQAYERHLPPRPRSGRRTRATRDPCRLARRPSFRAGGARARGRRGGADAGRGGETVVVRRGRCVGGVGGLCARAVCRQSGTSSSVPELEFTSSCCVSVAEESDSEQIQLIDAPGFTKNKSKRAPRGLSRSPLVKSDLSRHGNKISSSR